MRFSLQRVRDRGVNESIRVDMWVTDSFERDSE